MLTELERINHLKAVLIHYANEHDNKHNGFAAIQSVQKMAGFCNEKDYIIALADGLKYGNWPWTNYQKQMEDRINRQGQKTVTSFVNESSNIDEYINKTLASKKELK